MPEQSYEIVASDPDIESIIVTWYESTGLFIKQIEKGGAKGLLMFNKDEIKQLIAVLQAFLTNPEPHLSNCTLHNSPAYPLEPCTCR